MSTRTILGAVCVALLAGCSSTQQPDLSHADIARVKDVTSSFGPDFKVTDVAPTGIDPKLLNQQALPPNVKFDPPDCGHDLALLPPGLKGNMAAVTAEGQGNRYITIAVETSEEVPLNRPEDKCKRVAMAGPAMRGAVESVDAPPIEGVETMASHRVVQTSVNKQVRTGQLYSYIAKFGQYLVIVTANPLVLPNQPVAQVDTQRASALLAAAVKAVKG